MKLIRKKIYFKTSLDCKIDYNYQHKVLKNIYYYISLVDKNLEKTLHNEGFRYKNNQKYKLFNWTLRFNNVKFSKEGIEINEESTIIMIISGNVSIVNKIMEGMKKIGILKIDNNIFEYVSDTTISNIKFDTIMCYKSISPIVQSTYVEGIGQYYLSPYEHKFYENLVNNLKRKYELVYKEVFKDEIYFEIDDIDKVKQSLFKIKEGYIKGYEFLLWVETTPKMQKIIYYYGIGQNSSMGAGAVDIVKVGV